MTGSEEERGLRQVGPDDITDTDAPPDDGRSIDEHADDLLRARPSSPLLEPVISPKFGPYIEFRPVRSRVGNRPMVVLGDQTPSFVVLAEYDPDGDDGQNGGGAIFVLFGRGLSGPRIPLAIATLDKNSASIVPIFTVSSLGYARYELEASSQVGKSRVTLLRQTTYGSAPALSIDARARLPVGGGGWTDPTGLPGIQALLALPELDPISVWNNPSPEAATRVVRTLPGVFYQAHGENRSNADEWIQFHDSAAVPPGNAVPFESRKVATGAAFSIDDYKIRGRSLRNGLCWVVSSTGPTYTAVAKNFWVATEHRGG